MSNHLSFRSFFICVVCIIIHVNVFCFLSLSIVSFINATPVGPASSSFSYIINSVTNIPNIFYTTGKVGLFTEELNTTIRVSSGDTLNISSTGDCCYTPGKCFDSHGDPDLELVLLVDTQPSLPDGSLVYQIATSSTNVSKWLPATGSIYADNGSGFLFLAFWDVNNFDNTGEFHVSVELFPSSFVDNKVRTQICYEDVAVPNGVFLFDTGGNKIQSHGASITEVNGTYYMYGESDLVNYFANLTITIYSSTNLADWKYEGYAVNQSQVTSFMNMSSETFFFAIERPHVLFNTATQNFVMWLHVWTYDFVVGGSMILTSASPYTNWSILNFDEKTFGRDGGDFSLFIDPQSTSSPKDAYRIVYNGDNPDPQSMYVLHLTPDYLAISGVVSFVRNLEGLLESPGIFYESDFGCYYLFSGLQNGFVPTSTFVWRAFSLSGPWIPTNITLGYLPDPLSQLPDGLPSWNGQTSFILDLGFRKVWIADRWAIYDCISESTKNDCYHQPGFGLVTQLPNATVLWLNIHIQSEDNLTIYWNDFFHTK